MPAINDIWTLVDKAASGESPRAYTRVASQPDLLLAMNYYPPGYRNQFHRHSGTSQSFLVMKGELTLRTRKDAASDPEVHRLKEGSCCMISTDEFYQLENESDGPLVLYQAKQPTDMLEILGKAPVKAREYFGDAV